MSPQRPDPERERSVVSVCCERHYIPPCPRNFLYLRCVSPTLQRVFTHVRMNRLRWNHSLLGQGRTHAVKEYVLICWTNRDLFLPLHCAAFEAAPGPISATAFNRNGTIFAYAVSYDWSKGHSGMTPGHPNKLMLHACKEEEVKRRPKK